MKVLHKFLVMVVVPALFAGCGGLSDVGEQESAAAPPVADVVVLNHPFQKDASGNVTAQVRSGSEVFLSGKDSDGTVAPVLDYKWEQMPSDVSQVDLIVRNKNTRSFTAPMTGADLQFRLTVTDSNGRTDQKNVRVTVAGVPDSGRFLAYDLDDVAAGKVKLVAIADQEVTPDQLSAIGDIQFNIVVRRLVDYTTPGVDGPYVEVARQTFTGKWLASAGIGSDCDDLRNPVFEMAKPAVDIDDILAAVDPDNPALEPNTALVDKYGLKLELAITATPALPAGITAQVCAPEVEPPSVGPAAAVIAHKARDPFGIIKRKVAAEVLEISLPQLLGDASETQDTPESAEKYYAAIDPAGTRTTLLDWLKANDFIDDSKTDFTWVDVEAGSTAHAVYTNNFDLGFGRDMYARVKNCTGPMPTFGQPIDVSRRGQCDIAAVVINYASLEGAAKKVNPVLAVAMEYGPTATLNRRIVQFYTFAPDLVTGQFQRVSSANLDGRGEKYMPQVCTSCHGGTPGGLIDEAGVQTYANAGDVNATFLPWDLDSFLYSDSEGVHSDKSYADQQSRPLYTRAAQAESLRKLNQIAYLTYEDVLPERRNRFALARQLVEGWYGTDHPTTPTRAFMSSTFAGDFTPPGWSVNGVDGVAGNDDDNPAAAKDLYHNVFARNCRACHVAHAPADEAAGGQLELFAGESTFNTCDKNVAQATNGDPLEPQRVGQAHQLPIACYRQFLDAPKLAQRVSEGTMPFARLTLDRLWVAPTGATSAGSMLVSHLQREYESLPVEQRPVVGAPGASTACFRGIPAQDPTPTAPGVLVRGNSYAIDASCSLFPQQFTWTLTVPEGSQAFLANPTSPFPVLRDVDVLGTYSLKLETAADASQDQSWRRRDTPIVPPTISDVLMRPVEGNVPVDGESRRLITVTGQGGDGGLRLGSVVSSSHPSILEAARFDDQRIELVGRLVSDQRVTIGYDLSDEDAGQPATGGTFGANVLAEDLLASGFQRAAVTARRLGQVVSPIQIDLRTGGGVSGSQGQELEYSISVVNSLTGTDSESPSDRIILSDAVNGIVSYIPPAGRMSQFREGATPVAFTSTANPPAPIAPDTFRYSVKYKNTATPFVQNLLVTVPLLGTNTAGTDAPHVSFAAVNSNLEARCSSCHESTFAGGTVTVAAARWFVGGDAKATYCNLIQGSDTRQAFNSGDGYILRSEPTSSAIYQKAIGGLSHQRATALAGIQVLDPNVPADEIILSRLLKWISEGAYFTGAANQDCP